jgi:hypothetical protein
MLAFKSDRNDLTLEQWRHSSRLAWPPVVKGAPLVAVFDGTTVNY